MTDEYILASVIWYLIFWNYKSGNQYFWLSILFKYSVIYPQSCQNRIINNEVQLLIHSLQNTCRVSLLLLKLKVIDILW